MTLVEILACTSRSSGKLSFSGLAPAADSPQGKQGVSSKEVTVSMIYKFDFRSVSLSDLALVVSFQAPCLARWLAMEGPRSVYDL